MPQVPEKNTKSIKPLPAIGLFFAAFILGGIIFSIFWNGHLNNVISNLSQQIKPFRQNSNTYQFINPLLGYDVPGNVKEFNEYLPLQKQITDAVTNGNISNLDGYAVYFRDLSSGRWMGINENDNYSPGSLMKVAIMVTYYKDAENDPSVLQKQLVYSSSTVDQINGVPFSSPSNLQVGQKYSVEQLIEAMIINSDNGAKDVLIDNIDQKSFIEVHTDLGLPNPLTPNFTITAKQYSILLRVLYNSTYLSRSYSEKALQIMSKAIYDQGLVAGVPQNTTVAQKFGEALDQSNPANPEINLSNCGIIYHSSDPYILCVMTKGKTVDALSQTISLISRTVWNGVESYSKK